MYISNFIYLLPIFFSTEISRNMSPSSQVYSADFSKNSELVASAGEVR